MLSKPAVKCLGIPLELALWVPPAIGATGGIGIGAVLGQWSVGVPAGGVLLAAVGIAVSFTGAVLVVAPVIFVRQSVRALEESGSGNSAA